MSVSEILVITPDRNSVGKNDYTGAFLPEARAFMKHHGIAESNHLKVDISASFPNRRKQVSDFIGSRIQAVCGIAFFTHGLKRKLPQLGWDTKNAGALASVIARSAAGQDPAIMLYACSTADGEGPGGDGGFADALRDELCREACVHCHVDAHLYAAHTTKNPYVRRFEGHGAQEGGIGGSWLIAPGTPKFKTWRRMLLTEFRFAFPFMTAGEIADAVAEEHG